MRRFAALCACVLLLSPVLPATRTEAAQQVTEPQGRFTLTVPDGFTAVNPGESPLISFRSLSLKVQIGVESERVLGGAAMLSDDVISRYVQEATASVFDNDITGYAAQPPQRRVVGGLTGATYEFVMTDEFGTKLRGVQGLLFKGASVALVGAFGAEANFPAVRDQFEAAFGTVAFKDTADGPVVYTDGADKLSFTAPAGYSQRLTEPSDNEQIAKFRRPVAIGTYAFLFVYRQEHSMTSANRLANGLMASLEERGYEITDAGIRTQIGEQTAIRTEAVNRQGFGRDVRVVSVIVRAGEDLYIFQFVALADDAALDRDITDTLATVAFG